MSKRIDCVIPRFTGYVLLRDPLTLPLIAKWEEGLGYISREVDLNKRYTEIESRLFPLVCEFVEEWHLENIGHPTPQNFPDASAGTSAKSIHALAAWLITECQKIYNGNEDPDPNA